MGMRVMVAASASAFGSGLQVIREICYFSRLRVYKYTRYGRRIQVKRIITIVLAITALAFAGCQDKPNSPQASAPKDTVGGQIQPLAAHGGAGPEANPHAGMKPQGISMGADHKGKVLSTMDAAGYTYIEVEEKGQKLWVAVIQVKVKAGDEVEFPDSPPMENFHSKTLSRTFDKIIFSSALRINGQPVEMGGHPKGG
jgi:hypothetical protein